MDTRTALSIVRARNYTRQALRCLTKGHLNAATEYLDLAQNETMQYLEERELDDHCSDSDAQA
jgi:hypothetical protein